MPKLPGFKRININDYPNDMAPTIEKLGSSLNVGIETLYDALNSKLTVTDNLSAYYKEFDVKVDASGNPLVDTYIGYDKQFTPNALITVKVTNKTNSGAYPLSAPWVSWTPAASSIKIDNIKGLSTGNTYTFRVLILA